jgi:hypothetical protein
MFDGGPAKGVFGVLLALVLVFVGVKTKNPFARAKAWKMAAQSAGLTASQPITSPASSTTLEEPSRSSEPHLKKRAARNVDPDAPRRYSGRVEEHLKDDGLLLTCSKLTGSDAGAPGTYVLYHAPSKTSLMEAGDRFMFYAHETETFQYRSAATGRMRTAHKLEYAPVDDEPVRPAAATAPQFNPAPVSSSPLGSPTLASPSLIPTRRVPSTPTREEVANEILRKYGGNTR